MMAGITHLVRESTPPPSQAFVQSHCWAPSSVIAGLASPAKSAEVRTGEPTAMRSGNGTADREILQNHKQMQIQTEVLRYHMAVSSEADAKGRPGPGTCTGLCRSENSCRSSRIIAGWRHPVALRGSRASKSRNPGTIRTRQPLKDTGSQWQISKSKRKGQILLADLPKRSDLRQERSDFISS